MSYTTPSLGGYYYGRAYQVSLQPPGAQSAIVYGTEGDRPSPLRVAFEIDRDLSSKSNKSSIVLFNLAQDNRQTLKPDTLVQVKAGYTGLCSTIYIGYCAKITTERSGPDVVTKLECGDGEPYITYATFDWSYSEPVGLLQVLQDLAAAMQVDLGGQVAAAGQGIAKGLPDKIYSRGLHLHGSCRHSLDKLLHPLKIDWSVQNGQLFILPRNLATVVEAQIISPSTGLVGIPTDNADYVAFQSLLNPHIVPGGVVQLQSQNKALSKAYKLRKVKYQGDSHGGDWVADCEGVPFTQTLIDQKALPTFKPKKAAAKK